MTEAMANQNMPPTENPPSIAAPRRSLLAEALRDTWMRWGARVGIVWVALMVLAAAFAPFIANSHPMLMQVDGEWSSPMLRYLTVTDVLLLIGAVAAVVIWLWRGLVVRDKLLLWVAAMGLITLGGVWVDGLHPFVVEGHRGFLPAETAEAAEGGIAIGSLLWWMLRWIGLVAATVMCVTCLIAVLRSQHSTWLGRAVVLALAVLVSGWLVASPVSPPETIVYERYREMAQGESIRVWYAPVRYSPSDRLRDQPELRLTGPSLAHPMGTTANGADLFSNMVYATRIALAIGFISTSIALLIGVFIGGLMGYFSGWIDLLGMRLVEMFSAIPTLFLLLAFVAAFGANLYAIMAIIGLTGWVGYALFIRAEFLKLRRQDFVLAAEALGLPLWSILFRHMLPNGVAPVLVTASFGVASAILAESTLSFLGIGLVEESSWGKLLNQALGVGGTFYWWIALYPGLAIFLTVFAYNLIGEALRDSIDPHLKKAAAL